MPRWRASPASSLPQQGGALTAASASQICDGAAGLMVVNQRSLKALGVAPLARLHHMTVLGHDPVTMLEAAIPATTRALQKAGMSIDEIDLFEVNEAFASVPLAWLLATGADPERRRVTRQRSVSPYWPPSQRHCPSRWCRPISGLCCATPSRWVR